MKRLVCHELAAEFKDKFHSQYQMHLYIYIFCINVCLIPGIWG